MPPTATEIATLPLQPGVDLETPGSEGHNVVLSMIAALSKVNGYMGMHYGRQVECPDNLLLAIGMSTFVQPMQPESKNRH
jgi:hypothetical protein